MDKVDAVQWFESRFDAKSVRVGASLLLSLSCYVEQTDIEFSHTSRRYIDAGILPELLEKLKDKGWDVVEFDTNLLQFIRDIDDILTVMAFSNMGEQYCRWN